MSCQHAITMVDLLKEKYPKSSILFLCESGPQSAAELLCWAVGDVWGPSHNVFNAYEGNAAGELVGCIKTKEITVSSAIQAQLQLDLGLIYVHVDCIYACSDELISVDTGESKKGALDFLLMEQMSRFPSDPDMMSSKEGALNHQNDMCIPFLMGCMWPNRVIGKAAYQPLQIRKDLLTHSLVFAHNSKPMPEKRKLFDPSVATKKMRLAHNDTDEL